MGLVKKLEKNFYTKILNYYILFVNMYFNENNVFILINRYH